MDPVKTLSPHPLRTGEILSYIFLVFSDFFSQQCKRITYKSTVIEVLSSGPDFTGSSSILTIPLIPDLDLFHNLYHSQLCHRSIVRIN